MHVILANVESHGLNEQFRSNLKQVMKSCDQEQRESPGRLARWAARFSSFQVVARDHSVLVHLVVVVQP
jgi:hypothetical protein